MGRDGMGRRCVAAHPILYVGAPPAPVPVHQPVKPSVAHATTGLAAGARKGQANLSDAYVLSSGNPIYLSVREKRCPSTRKSVGTHNKFCVWMDVDIHACMHA